MRRHCMRACPLTPDNEKWEPVTSAPRRVRNHHMKGQMFKIIWILIKFSILPLLSMLPSSHWECSLQSLRDLWQTETYSHTPLSLERPRKERVMGKTGDSSVESAGGLDTGGFEGVGGFEGGVFFDAWVESAQTPRWDEVQEAPWKATGWLLPSLLAPARLDERQDPHDPLFQRRIPQKVGNPRKTLVHHFSTNG